VAARYRLVAVISGRRSQEVAELLAVPRVQVLGLYGDPDLATAIAPSVRAAIADVPEAWIEDKGVSLAVHYRQAPEPIAARTKLLGALGPVMSSSGLELLEGKRVLELVPAGRPGKGQAVERLVRGHGLEAVLYAGDDLADLDAFAALDRLGAEGIATVRAAVRWSDTPAELLEAADLVAEGPAGLVALLGTL
jgi:trehalose 6-phosphate phosphatase